MVHHMKVEHGNEGTELSLVCSATLVAKKSKDSDRYVECPVLAMRTGSVDLCFVS